MPILYRDDLSYLDSQECYMKPGMTELKELEEYWNGKYSNVSVSLWSNTEGDKYFGKMMGASESIDLFASTIGDLISQGEAFLRRTR